MIELSNEAKVQHLIGKFTAENEYAQIGEKELGMELGSGELSKEANSIFDKIIGFSKLGGLSYASATFLLKKGYKVSRKNWGWKGTNVYIKVMFPSENSEMTEPYTYMHKKVYDDNKNLIADKRFPIPLSDESLFASDWFLVEE